MTEIASFDIGRHVECDICGEVLTDDTRTGGFIFFGKGVGPCCADREMAIIRHYGEDEQIRGRCTPGMAFADWIRELRAQVPDGNRIRILNGIPGLDDGGCAWCRGETTDTGPDPCRCINRCQSACCPVMGPAPESSPDDIR